VSRDGRTLLVSDYMGGSHAIHEFDVLDGSRRRVVGRQGDGPLQFRYPSQVCIAPDDFVFVAELGNRRVQVLTPTLDFHCFVGVGQLSHPIGVCANADVVVATELGKQCIVVFRRGDGALLRRFGSFGDGYSQLLSPDALCFMSDHEHVAVADSENCRVSVFSIAGDFIRHVGAGVLSYPRSVACSAFDELVVADSFNRRVVVFSASGEPLKTMGSSAFRGVVVHGGAVYVHDPDGGGDKCVVFT
jgi:tripartite motif-containing protein 2/3/tripartite motif-containing protein 71